MAQRMAWRGRNPGGSFWVYSRCPRCRGIKNEVTVLLINTGFKEASRAKIDKIMNAGLSECRK